MKPTCLSSGLLAVLFLFSLASCQRDNLQGIGGEPGSNTATISFLLESPMSLPTRAVSTVSDNHIETLDILAFDASGSTDKYLYSVGSVTVDDTGTDNIKKVTASVQKKNFPQRFVLISNARSTIAALGDIPEGTDKATLLEPVMFSKTDNWSNHEGEFSPIPMWGETETASITDTDLTLSATLLRMAARVEVYAGEDIDDKTFRIAGLHVYNPNSRGYILPSGSNIIYDNGASTHKVDAPSLPADPETLATPISYVPDDETGLLPWVYLFEAAAGSSPEDASCVVVEGYYGDDDAPSFYRLDFASVDGKGVFEEFKPLLRNHRYIFNITAVEGRGYATAGEAFEAGGYNLGFKLYIWDMGDITDFVFNSNYVLGVSRKEITLPRQEATDELLVTTDYPKGWEATVDYTKYDWLTVTLQASGGPNEKDPLVFKVDENTTNTARTGYIEVTAGTLSQIITVHQTARTEPFLTVTDNNGDDVDELLFMRYPGSNNPSQQEFTVTWGPAASSVAVSHTDNTFPGFDYGTGDNVSSFGALADTPKTFRIQPPAFTDTEITENPFIEKSSTATFTLTEGSETASGTIQLRHLSYDITADIDDLYYMDGTLQSINVRSNVSWTARFKSNNAVSALHTTQGGNNRSGEAVGFTMVDDVNKLVTDKTATIVFDCTTEHGDTFTKEFVINVTSEDPVIKGSNSYMVKPGGNEISIPVNWANKDGVARIRPTDDIEPVFIWTDNPDGMSSAGSVNGLRITGLGVNRKLVVTTGKSVGNAVVGIKVGGELAWSWLVWVTDYDPDNGGRTYTRNGFTMMDRHLGVITDRMDVPEALGLYFQWGRKDPIIYPDVLTYNSSGGTGSPPLTDMEMYDKEGNPMHFTANSTSLYKNIEPGIRNPTVFYSGSRTNDESYLWKPNDGSKGPQDPCPDGWRIPPQSVFSDISYVDFDAKNIYLSIPGMGDWQPSGYLLGSEQRYAMLGVYTNVWTCDVSPANKDYSIVFQAFQTTQKQTTLTVSGLTAASTVRCVKD